MDSAYFYALWALVLLVQRAFSQQVLANQTLSSGSLADSIAMGSVGAGNQHVLARGKRYLDFLATSRMFFRVNCKNNIIPKPTIWAHGYGFRANIPIENTRSVRPFRRDTYDTLSLLMEKHGFDGRACILKAYCSAHLDTEKLHSQGMLFKLLKHIFTLDEEDKRHLPYLRQENCEQIMHNHCPLSFNSISPYTDDV